MLRTSANPKHWIEVHSVYDAAGVDRPGPGGREAPALLARLCAALKAAGFAETDYELIRAGRYKISGLELKPPAHVVVGGDSASGSGSGSSNGAAPQLPSASVPLMQNGAKDTPMAESGPADTDGGSEEEEAAAEDDGGGGGSGEQEDGAGTPELSEYTRWLLADPARLQEVLAEFPDLRQEFLEQLPQDKWEYVMLSGINMARRARLLLPEGLQRLLAAVPEEESRNMALWAGLYDGVPFEEAAARRVLPPEMPAWQGLWLTLRVAADAVRTGGVLGSVPYFPRPRPTCPQRSVEEAWEDYAPMHGEL